MKKPDPITCTVITPMFSYGNGCLEPRAAEIKGLLRSVYRIANPILDVKTLYLYETMLFGGQMREKSGEIVTKASPLRIQMFEQCPQPNRRNGSDYLLLHKNIAKLDCYSPGKKFDMIFSSISGHADFSSIPCLESKDPLSWYQDLFHLSLVISGIGKRSRRGRGCMTVDALLQISGSELPKWIAGHLNAMCAEQAYTENEDGVCLMNSFGKAIDRPFIREIRLGKLQNAAGVHEYLKRVDMASHEIKGEFHSSNATGFSAGQTRFASSVIVSMAEIKDGIVPVYTLLNAVYNRRLLDPSYVERNKFIRNIEAGENA